MRRFFWIAAIFLCVLIAAACPLSAKADDSKKGESSYLIDESGQLSFSQVSGLELSGSFIPMSGTLKAGFTDSVYWVRLMPGFFQLNDTDGDGQVYLVVLNMLLENATIYIPSADPDEGYKTYRSGYGNRVQSVDEHFISPVCKLPPNGPTRPVYVRLSSPNTLNTSFYAMDQKTFSEYSQFFILALGLLFGVFATLLVYNIIAFLKLHNGFYLYFVIYILIIMAYQGTYTGAVLLFDGPLPNVLQEHITLLGLLTTGGMVLFARSFMDTKRNVPRFDTGLKGSLLLMAAGVALHLTGFGQPAIFTTIGIAYGSGVLLIAAAIICIRRNLWQAKYFLTAWILVAVSLVIFSLRGGGILPNTALTTLSPMIFAALEFTVLNFAMAERLRLLQVDIALDRQRLIQAQENAKSAELAFLHAQIRPHFLFNAMNSIATLCVVQPVEARKSIMDLALYLQHLYGFNNLTGKISLETELSFIQAYMRIQQVRFGEQLKVHFELDEVKGAWLPPLVIEPLVENAIRHGIRKSSKSGTVTVKVKRFNDSVRIDVEDDGAGISPEKMDGILQRPSGDEKGVGLANIDLRLRRIYGSGLTIVSEAGHGTKVSFTIPLNEREEDERDFDR